MTIINRRRFLGAAGGTTVLAAQNMVFAQQSSGKPIWLTPAVEASGWTQRNQWHRPLGYNLVGFNSQQSATIKAALSLVAQRMLQPRMFQNADRFYKRWQLAPANQIGVQWNSTEGFEGWFRKTQIGILLMKGFPMLTVRNANLPANVNGRASVGTVRAFWSTPSNGLALRPIAHVQGVFDVSLNGQLVSKALKAVNRWAGVICHEMLHNLGHSHQGKQNDNEGFFIDAYQESVEYNGSWNPASTGWYLTGAGIGRCGV